jgi:hypothetical protein
VYGINGENMPHLSLWGVSANFLWEENMKRGRENGGQCKKREEVVVGKFKIKG